MASELTENDRKLNSPLVAFAGPPAAAAPPVPRQAASDGELIRLWLHGRSPRTQQVYKLDAGRFLAAVAVPLHRVRLADLQAYADALEAANLAPATRHRMLAAVKSLLTFGCRVGYLAFNVGVPLRLPPVRGRVVERVVEEGDVQRMIALEDDPRNGALLHLIYTAGLRVSEACGLTWRDVTPREDGRVQVTVVGKGAKVRTILLPAGVRRRLEALRGAVTDDAPVFRSRKGGHLHRSQVLRVVKAAARRAGLAQNVVVHSLRHSHATHAIAHGSPLHLVQRTLGHASLQTTGVYVASRPDESSAMYVPA